MITVANAIKFDWWIVQSDVDNAMKIRNYLQMQKNEKALVKLYVAKNNQNTLNRIKAFIKQNIELVDFYLKYIYTLIGVIVY